MLCVYSQFAVYIEIVCLLSVQRSQSGVSWDVSLV